MEFEASFFEGEEREGFYIAPMMKKAWAAQLEVLEEVKKVCQKHKIRFFADYGTLLGTIRHKGYIPWDDDLDIAMIRTDYEKFLKVAPDELPAGFRVINVHNEPEFTEMLARVVNRSDICFQEEHLKKYHGCPYAVGIDIFILDYMSPVEEENQMIAQLLSIVLGQVKSIETDAFTEDEREQYLCQIEQLCHCKINRTKSIANQLYCLGDQLCSLYQEEEAREITNMIEFGNGPHYRMPKEIYGDSIEMPFENTTIPVPVGYETILSLQYGKDYMTPINIRGGHDYPFYKSQESIVKEKFGFIPE